MARLLSKVFDSIKEKSRLRKERNGLLIKGVWMSLMDVL